MPGATDTRRALIVGGSLSGLFAGNLLRLAGWDVDIYERSPEDLDSRGGGIVLQPDVVEVLRAVGVDPSAIDLGVRSMHRTEFGADGRIVNKVRAVRTHTSWPLVYSLLKGAFGHDRYHQNKTLVGVEQSPRLPGACAVFADGDRQRGDLLIGADGSNSTVRRLCFGGREPTYAGYLAWRGLVAESEMPASSASDLLDDFALANNPGTHILGYLVPGDDNDSRAGKRYYNWVWYRVAGPAQLRAIMVDKYGEQRGYSMPEGLLAPTWVAHVHREAAQLLPPVFRDVVTATRYPFVQAIRDLIVPSMIDRRVILLGDAAFVPRPHTAASTSKAAANALSLIAALDLYPHDLDAALRHWEPPQLALGLQLYEEGTSAGDRLLFSTEPIINARYPTGGHSHR